MLRTSKKNYTIVDFEEIKKILLWNLQKYVLSRDGRRYGTRVSKPIVTLFIPK